jgi:hypothetical protein
MNSEKGLKWMLVAILVLVLIIGALNIGLFKLTEKFLQEANEPTEAPMAAVLPTAIPVSTGELTIEAVEIEIDTFFQEKIPVDEIYYVAPGRPAGELYQTPVEMTDVFNEESSWLIAEPGVILDDTAAWVIPSVEAKHFVNIPEGGFTYFSLGEGAIGIGNTYLMLPGAEGLNYLVLVRGRIDDTIVDSDLNLTATVIGFVPGHAIWSIMPPGAYVSKGWFGQQLVTSTTTGGTNCGATGCTTVHVVLFDVDSHFYQKFEVKADNLDSWKLLESN